MAGLSLLLCYMLTLSVQGQLSISWNGFPSSGPVAQLVYHDEVLVDTGTTFRVGDPTRRGALICESRGVSDRVSWHFPTGFIVNDVVEVESSREVQQIREADARHISRLSRNRTINRADLNGLWHCRLNANEDHTFIVSVPGELLVGFYDRAEGGARATGVPDTQGAVTVIEVSISSSSFINTPQTFTLFGNTSGGPPTTNYWTRDGDPITTGGSYDISIGLNGRSLATFQQTRYRSILIVTGRLPGVYQYSVSNRATNPDEMTTSVTIEDAAAPTDFMAIQSGIRTVTVSWTAPPSPPSRGYRITINSTDFSSGVDVTETITLLLLDPGTHSIRIRSLSEHFPSDVVGPVEVTVLDLLAPVNVVSTSITATSITLSWTQPENSLRGDEYTISFQRLLGVDGCPSLLAPRTQISTATSLTLDNLLEGITYTINVTSSRYGFTSDPSIPAIVTTLDRSTLASVCTQCSSTRDISISVVASSLLTVIIYTTVLLVGCFYYCKFKKKNTCGAQADHKKVTSEQDVNEVKMKSC